MTAAPVAEDSARWTARQRALDAQLQGFWAEDRWPMRLCPLPQLAAGVRKPMTLRFQVQSPGLRTECKYACFHLFSSGAWRSVRWAQATNLHRIIAWLNDGAPATPSLLARDLAAWEALMRPYFEERGWWGSRAYSQLDASQAVRTYVYGGDSRWVFRALYRVIAATYDDRPEYEKEVWDLQALGAPRGQGRCERTLNFGSIAQPWLRQAAKAYLRRDLPVISAGGSGGRLQDLSTFAAFLAACCPTLQPGDIDRTVVLDYIGFLAARQLAPATYNTKLIRLRLFLAACAREGWAAVAEKPLIYDDDLKIRPKAQPRFIPAEVLQQLDRHLDGLPDTIRRMVVVLRESGMRIGELCTLPFDCLTQDADGDWFLRYYQGKGRTEHSIPIARDVVAALQEQQHSVRAPQEQAPAALFFNRKGGPMQADVFRTAINRLCYERDIRDSTGRLYRLTPHQFRHSKGTDMINHGVPQHIVQRFFNHGSPTMTSRYAHIHDRTLKEAFLAYRGKTVSVTGQVVAADGAVAAPEAQWLKRNILAQALPNGTCALPTIKQGCPHANACLTCAHFRTDRRYLPQHRDQLNQTRALIAAAQAHGWERQVEMNRRVEANLLAMLAALEGEDASTERDGAAPACGTPTTGGAATDG